MIKLTGRAGKPDFVPMSSELNRVSRIPRRVMAPEDLEWLADEMTARLKKPRGLMRLKPVQAWALFELGTVGGLFAPITVGGGKCVAGETEVFDTASGSRRRVDQLGVFEVSVMDGQGKITKAKTLASASGKKHCLRLTLRDGSSIVLSDDHPVYTSRGWVCATDLVANDLVATARSVPMPSQETIATDDEVLLTAYLLADGGLSQGTVTFTNADKRILREVWQIAERLADHTKNVGGGWKKEGVSIVRQPSRAYEFNLSGLSWFRRKWGLYGLAKNKRLPAEFWGLQERQIGLFLNRFWACDGWVCRDKGPAMVLASEKMVDDLRFLLLRLGVHSRKAFKLSKLGEKTFDSWRLTIAKHSVEAFFAKVGLIFSKEEQSESFLVAYRSRARNTNVDIVPLECSNIPRISDELGYQKRGGCPERRRGNRPRTAISKFFASSPGQYVSRQKFEKFCANFGYQGALSWLATSDLCWERIQAVDDAGVLQVFDLSVPGFGNFVGNNMVVHNTLISLLAPVVMKAQRPLLIVPAGLVEKTKRDKEVLEQHFYLPLFLRIMSYEWLGREQAGEDKEKGRPGAIDEWDPDLVILDECHRAKNNRGAAVARRITRFFRDRKDKKLVLVPGHFQSDSPRHTQCSALSGTVTKRSIQDYAHILTWCLPAHLLPIPTHWNDLNLWSEALDEKKGDGPRVDPGALEILCADDADRELWKTDRVLAARRTYRRRLIETPGVVATYETQVDASLVVRGRAVEPGPSVDEAFERLRSEWVTPDGWSIADALTFARHARELALGFFYRWSPRPPIEWQLARTAWHQHVRQVLKRSRTHDSEKQVRNAVLASALKLLGPSSDWHRWAKEIATPPKDRTKRALDAAQRQACATALIAQLKGKTEEVAEATKLFAWKGVEDTFEINTVPVWIDSAACEFAAKWAKQNAGIIWVEHRCVGERLRDEFGLSYYGRKGLDATGKFIDDHDRRKPLVASRPANSEGRNLQGWSKNLVMSLLPNGARNEQLLGRTHREGQMADEVEVEFVVSCEEHLLALDQALRDAKYIESSTGAPQKLLLATLDVDENALRGAGPRWLNE